MSNVRRSVWLAGAGLLICPALAGAVIVNVDINGQRNGDPSPGVTYVGQGAAGGGTTFNGYVANSTTSAGSATDNADNSPNDGNADRLTFGQTGLLDSAGNTTGIGFSVGPVGADNNGANGPVTAPNSSLYGDYAFIHSAGNTGVPAAHLLLSGLTGLGAVDLYFYRNFGNGTAYTVPGGVRSDFTFTNADGFVFTSVGTPGLGNAGNTEYFPNVPVTGDTLDITFDGGGGLGILNGFTVSSVPEPTSIAMLGFAGIGLLARNRRAK